MQIIDVMQNVPAATKGPQIIYGSRPDGDLMDAHRQWAKRPKEDWCMDVQQMLDRTETMRKRSVEGTPTDARTLRVEAEGEGGLALYGSKGVRADLSHLGFSQLCARVGVPASYMRTLPAGLAAQNMNHGLQHRPEDASALLPLWRMDQDPADRLKVCPTLRALTTEKYARVWDAPLARKLADFIERNAGWGAAEAFRTANGQTSRAWGTRQALPLAFVGEEGFFAFTVNYDKPVEIEGTSLVPGFFLRNSETGTGSIEVVFFFFDFACSNMIVWGAKNVRTIKIRHVGDAENRALSDYGEVQAEMGAMADASTGERLESIRRARRTLIADTKDKVVDAVFRGFDIAKKDAVAAYEAAEKTPRYGDPRSAWGMVQGLTEVSQKHAFGTDRVAADRAAGKVLEKFAF